MGTNLNKEAVEKSFVIGITGGSGSGKTSLIADLRNRFSESELSIISQDDYYKPRAEQLFDESGVQNFDLPHSIDLLAFAEEVHRLLKGETVTRLEYAFNNPTAEAKTITFKPAPILLLEGLFVFHEPLIREMLDLKVFIHTKENLKIIRRIKRDREERNYPLEDVLYRYERHVMPTFEKYIRPFQEEADIVINNNDSYHQGLEVLVGFLKNKIVELA